MRRASRADLAALEALEAHFPGDRISRATFRRWLTVTSAELWVAVRELDGVEQVVGDALVAYRRGSSSARLMSLVSHPEQRRQGVAATLLRVAEEAAGDRGVARMRLEVRCDNHAAISLYQRAGYQRVAWLPAYYHDGSDGWRLEKHLDAAPANTLGVRCQICASDAKVR